MKVALVHDWLTGMRGGEKVLESFCNFFPDAHVLALFHIPGTVSSAIENRKITTSYLQKFPWIKDRYRYYLPLMPHAIESLDLSSYDLVISTSHCVAKGVKTAQESLHICYCFTPMRYIWDQFEPYFGTSESGIFTRFAMKMIRPSLQKWDVRSSGRVRHFIADSQHVRDRIQKFYRREAQVIYPPVDTVFFVPDEKQPGMDYYLMVSALAPYKRIDLAIGAFNANGKKLKIIGSGQSEKALKALARPNIEFLGWQSNETIRRHYQSCRALIFPGTEDFGIAPVEAMACGKPVVAYREGGAAETILDKRTGIFFDKPVQESLLAALDELESRKWNFEEIRKHAQNFSRERFRMECGNFFKNVCSIDLN